MLFVFCAPAPKGVVVKERRESARRTAKWGEPSVPRRGRQSPQTWISLPSPIIDVQHRTGPLAVFLGCEPP